MKQKSLGQKAAVSFWGVRGSVSSHQIKNSRTGGHTACVAIRYQNRWFICDAGTGIRQLGRKLESRKEPIALFISHLHWDHIFGLPFFKPLYQRGRKVLLAGPSHRRQSFKKLFHQIMTPPFFPIRPGIWKAKIGWKTIRSGKIKLGAVLIESKKVRHHDGTFGFCFHFPGGKKIIYVTDQELSPSNRSFARWIEGADLLIHDSQYDRKKYRSKKGWGHSAFENVLEMAVQSKVKNLVLFHHDPDANDRLLEKRLAWCRKRIKQLKSGLKCSLAKEGATVLV